MSVLNGAVSLILISFLFAACSTACDRAGVITPPSLADFRGDPISEKLFRLFHWRGCIVKVTATTSTRFLVSEPHSSIILLASIAWGVSAQARLGGGVASAPGVLARARVPKEDDHGR